MLKLSLNKPGRNFGLALLILFSAFVFACQPLVDEIDNSAFNSANSAKITPTPKENLTEFESELKSMRIADFDYIYTLKRKDEAAFVSADKAFVRANIHYATNRTSFVEDDTILFIGSNYKHTDENVAALKERFEFQDFSKSEEQIEKEQAEKKAEREKEQAEAENANSDNVNSSENSNK